MIKVRSDEPEYSFLWDKETKKETRYGSKIELTQLDSGLRNESLNINNDAGIGENPNRYKQHGFVLNADNCIGCHACEAACSEKNDNPAHIAFRSVGFVEGGTHPDYQRLNISMACNHCEDPVCLKGCPTGAYTKFAEYGAVLQDPDICFGCGYCTWVCPYNAPQLDPIKGEVSKCNMCVDRLEVNLKPACVSACLANALDFGVIENMPEGNVENKTSIPGFPDPEITRPNIRFQQTRSTHREMTRTDSTPIKYHRDDSVGIFTPVVDEKFGKERHWNWEKLLGSHESAHVMFTLGTQAVLGAFLLLVVGGLLDLATIVSITTSMAFIPLLGVMFVIQAFGLFKLNMHLGKPHRFYRGFNNLRYSNLSREIAGVSGFFAGFSGYVFFSLFDGAFFTTLANGFAGLGVISGSLGLYFMVKIYRIKARPFWDHWQSGSAFYGNTMNLGALLVGAIALPFLVESAEVTRQAVMTLGSLVFAGLLLEIIGHVVHGRDMHRQGGEGAGSFYEQSTTYGKSWITRNVLLGTSLVLAGVLVSFDVGTTLALTGWYLLLVLTIAAVTISRSLFFVLVIPTTMPGAFFWKNKGFEAHARETGLADMEQMGVVRQGHHAFKVGELLETIKTTSPKQMFGHIKDIFVWKSVD
ncbi:MAG: dimethyl sulfoxide reductase anchor subunit [Pseudomonadales bacterium]|nr:dimethyl sulfoxide reductase anchor subunit [Pseudomonadales bacterium]